MTVNGARGRRREGWIRSALLRRCRGERGAELVEFALVVPLLVLLVLGTIDSGFVLNDKIKIRQSVREAARLAAVNAYGHGGSCLLTGPVVANSTASGLETKRLMCRVKLYAADAGLVVRVALRIVSTPDNPSVSYAEGNLVVVCAETMTSSRSGMLRPVLDSRILRAKVAMRIANIGDVIGPVDGDETPLDPMPAGSTDADVTQKWNAFCTAAGGSSP